MRNIVLIIFFALVSGQYLLAQSEWKKDRKTYELSASEKEYPLYILYRGVHNDYKYDEESNFICDITFHEIVRVNNDKALSERNRIYISMYNAIDLLDLQARAISPDGKITSLDQKNIKEIEDENSTGYKIFAVEGAEVGGEIEYRYVKRVQGSVFNSEQVQFNAPLKKMEFGLKAPQNLEWGFRTVNDTTQVRQVDDSEEINEYAATFADVPAFVAESFAAGEPNRK
ncbi:MAG: DUF3857 domain-containing protein, partial [Cyclobacteriaceae bacterium]